MEENKPVRLQAYLAKCGFGSRRKCEEYILAGRVKVNGSVVKELGTRVTDNDMVRLDENEACVDRKVYFVLNKPPRYLCSNEEKNSDKPIALELFKNRVHERIFHVGRLDFLSSGLILYTNDGDFTNLITHPRYGIEKDYLVESMDDIPKNILTSYKNGIIIDDILYRLRDYQFLNSKKVLLTLLEGKNREIRRFFAYHEIGLKRIHRVRIGCVELNDLKSGNFRPLTEQELNWFLKKINKT